MPSAAKATYHASEAINKLLDERGLFGGITKSIDNIVNKTDDGWINAIKRAHTKDGVLKEGVKANWNAKQIAGSMFGVGAAARIATGGGIYKDGNGNTNLIGIPFI